MRSAPSGNTGLRRRANSRLEASLLADIDSFDLNEAERKARREQLASMQGGMSNLSMVFPEIVPAGAVRHLDLRTRDGDTREDPEWIARSSDFPRPAAAGQSAPARVAR